VTAEELERLVAVERFATARRQFDEAWQKYRHLEVELLKAGYEVRETHIRKLEAEELVKQLGG
jgi:hypothetical protein